MTILGIDPGSLIMGYAVITISEKNTPVFVEMDVLRLNKISDQATKLKMILETVQSVISKHKPDVLAIEAPFQGKNPQSMLKLGRAQGVAMATAMLNNIPVFEYAPRTVKQTVTGSGASSKEVVLHFLHHIIEKDFDNPKFFDATDALAVAVCHHLHSKNERIPNQNPSKKKKNSSWSNFVQNNPDLICF
jgi:crossover junction endodeoxyribonuclease RuvC